METPNSTIITKQTNGKILVQAEGGDYTLSPTATLMKELDSVIVRDRSNKTVSDFKVATVEKLVDETVSPSDTPINDIDTLFNELNDNFFFELSVAPGTLLPKEITKTLIDGDNEVIHNLGKNVIAFSVKDGDDFIAVGGSIINSNKFNINLSGGGPINDAEIILIYIN